ncbi:hypothetical protein HKCCE3408_00620 [Rhodobacterales bacterium HKCCE3408]|nr:hypothetical protein [Rhodobacterales bacterium HKCCE3408]
MKKTILAAAAAAAVLASGLAATADIRVAPSAQIRSEVAASANVVQTLGSIVFNCVVSGTPVEFPSDIYLSRAIGATPAGTQVSYTIPGGVTGVAVLPALAPGQGYRVHDVIPGGLPAGTACSAVLNN